MLDKSSILGLQPRDKAAMLMVNTKEIFPVNLHQNRVHFPAERNAFVLDHQHGRRDVTCKPVILVRACVRDCLTLPRVLYMKVIIISPRAMH